MKPISTAPANVRDDQTWARPRWVVVRWSIVAWSRYTHSGWKRGPASEIAVVRIAPEETVAEATERLRRGESADRWFGVDFEAVAVLPTRVEADRLAHILAALRRPSDIEIVLRHAGVDHISRLAAPSDEVVEKIVAAGERLVSVRPVAELLLAQQVVPAAA